MSQARRFVASYSVLVAGDISAKVLTFLAMALLARRLGAGLFGEIAFAAALVSYFTLIVGQGLEVYGVREASRSPEQATRIAGNILGLRIVSSLVAASLWIIVVRFLGRPPGLSLFFTMYGLNLLTAALPLGWFFQARQETRPVAVSVILSQLVFVAGIALFVRSESQLPLVPVFQCSGEVIGYLYLLRNFTRYGAMRPAFGPSVWAPILKSSIPMGLTGALGLVMLNFDTVLLGFLRSRTEVGEYGAAYKIIFFFYALLMLFGSTLLQLFSRHAASGEVLQRLGSRTLKFAMLLGMPVAAGGAVAARPLMSMVFGAEFAPGADALAILIWTIPILSARVVYRNLLISRDLQGLVMRRISVGASLNIALNLLLIPKFGYIGAALTTLLGEATMLYLYRRDVLARIATVRLFPHWWRPALATVPMAAVVLLMPATYLPLRIIVGAGVYFAAAWLAGAFSFRELAELLPVARDGDGHATADE